MKLSGTRTKAQLSYGANFNPLRSLGAELKIGVGTTLVFYAEMHGRYTILMHQ